MKTSVEAFVRWILMGVCLVSEHYIVNNTAVSHFQGNVRVCVRCVCVCVHMYVRICVYVCECVLEKAWESRCYIPLGTLCGFTVQMPRSH